jgi:Family of unknown function (DUF6185)
VLALFVVAPAAATTQGDGLASCSQPRTAADYEATLDIAASNPNRYPILHSAVRAVLPRGWDVAKRLIELRPSNQSFKAALACVFGNSIPATALGHVRRSVEKHRLSLRARYSRELFDASGPTDIGPWRIDATRGNFAISFLGSVFTVRKANWHLTVTLAGLRPRAITPFPTQATSTRIEWRLTRPQAPADVDLIVKPGFRLRLFLGGQGNSARWVRQVSWWSTTLIVPLMLSLLLIWSRLRTKFGREERRALLSVLVALALACMIFVFSPGFHSRGSPSLALLLVSAGLYVAARTWLLRSLDLHLIVIAGFLVSFGIVALYFAEITPWVSARLDNPLGKSTQDVLVSVELMLRGLSAVILTYFLLTGLVCLAAVSWPDPPSVRGTRTLFHASIIALAVIAVAQWAWAITSELGRQDRPNTWDLHAISRTGWFKSLSQQVEQYPVGLLYQLMALLPLVGLGAAVLTLRARGATQKPPSVFLPGGAEASILALLFAGFVVRPWGFVLGFWVPVAFLVAFTLLRLAVLHPRLKRWEEAIRRANPSLSAQAPSPLITHRRELLERSLELELIEHRERTLYDRAFEEGWSQSEYEAQRRPLIDETAQRTSASLDRSDPPALELPPQLKLAPNQLALASGPGGSWWSNGRIAVEKGWVLALIPVAIYTLELYKKRGSSALSWSARFAPLWLIATLTLEFAAWITLAFVFGCLYAHLPGSNGLVKGVTLTGTFLVADATGVHAAHWIGGAPTSAVLFRASQLLLFLIFLGVLLDRETVRAAGHHWRELLDHYQLRKNRGLVTYLAPLTIAIITIGQLLATGDLGKGLSEVVKNLPQAIPH